MSLFLSLSSISLGQYCRKSPAKSRGLEKDKKEGGVSTEGGLKPSDTMEANRVTHLYKYNLSCYVLTAAVCNTLNE